MLYNFFVLWNYFFRNFRSSVWPIYHPSNLQLIHYIWQETHFNLKIKRSKVSFYYVSIVTAGTISWLAGQLWRLRQFTTLQVIAAQVGFHFLEVESPNLIFELEFQTDKYHFTLDMLVCQWQCSQQLLMFRQELKK